MFNRDAERETITILSWENKRLKRENQRLRESLSELERYKKEYRELMGRLSDVEEVYIEKMEGFNQLEKEYRKALNQIMDRKKSYPVSKGNIAVWQSSCCMGYSKNPMPCCTFENNMYNTMKRIGIAKNWIWMIHYGTVRFVLAVPLL